MAELQTVCQCDNVTVIKKGFSGLFAILGFIVSAVLSIAFILVFYPYKTPDLYVFVLLGIFIGLSLLTGTYRMNRLYTVCHKCGKKNHFKS